MWRRMLDIRLIVVLAIALAAVAAFACGAAEEPAQPAAAAEPDAPAPAEKAAPEQARGAPAAAKKAAKPQLAQAAEAAAEPDAPDAVDAVSVAGAAAERTAATTGSEEMMDEDIYGRSSSDFGGDWYVPTKQVPGELKSYYHDGPRPTTWQENPRHATMVANGELLALEDRWVVEDDRLIMDVGDEIGIYGGTWRFSLGGWTLDYGQWSPPYCTNFDADTFTKPFMCKDVYVNDTGTVWTIVMREGLRWWHPLSTDPVNGRLVTMEDVEFAWIDLGYDVLKTDAPWRTRFPGVYKKGGGRRDQFTDAVTGELADFTVVDSLSYTLTYDTPNWTLGDTLEFAGGTRCEYYAVVCPKFHLAEFHPEYADPDKLEALIDEGGYSDWTELFNHRASIFGIYQIDIPWLGESILTRGGVDVGAEEAYLTSNPMFWAADPVGNQLPYYDNYHVVQYSSQEVATFRSMAGETDAGSFGTSLSELPMYQANMVDGDFSVYGWQGLGTGGIAQMQQTYNEDPEIGRWIRDIKFRQALSYALDRDSFNQVNNLGLGTIHSAAPGPTDPYYPGDEWATKFTTYDPAEANRLLDALGLVDTDGDGYRNKIGVLGGDTGNLELFGNMPSDLRFQAIRTANPALLFQEMLDEVGLKFDFKTDSNWNQYISANKEYFTMNAGFSGGRFVHNNFPNWCGSYLASAIGCWFVSRSAAGGTDTQHPVMNPGEADSTWLPIAPAHTWKADAGGDFWRMWEQYQTYIEFPRTDPRNIEAGKEIYRLTVENQYGLSTVAFTPNRMVIKRNNFRNVSKHSTDGYANNSAVYYFEDGTDNANNPGNRSKRFKSESFLTGLTY